MNNYFPHDSNARNSDKLLPIRMKYGAEGYGIYFMLLERLRDEKNYMSVKDYNVLAFDLRVDTSKLKSIIEDFGLFAFTDDGECFYSEGFNKRMEIKDNKSKIRSEAGKKGATKRWQKDSNAIALLSENNSKTENANAIAKEKNSKESKVKESKVKESKVNSHDDYEGASEAIQRLYGKFPSGILQQGLSDWIKQTDAKMVHFAVLLAYENGCEFNGLFNYIRKIINGWQQRGITSLEKAKEANKEFKARRDKGQKGFSKPSEQLKDLNALADERNTLSEAEKAEKAAELERKMHKYFEENDDEA